MPVTQADVDLVRRAYAHFNERYDELRSGDGLRSYHDEFYAPDHVMELVDNFPASGRFVGYEGYREWFSESYADYQDVQWEIDSIEPVHDRVVALVKVSGHAADDPTRLEVALGITYEMRDGRIGHVRVYLGHDRAIEKAASGG